MHRPGMLSIWFFVGVLLLAYGILILGSGLLNYSTPPPNVVLSDLHADIWWGALLLIMGAFYTFKFRPGRNG
jgi:hypothetical protein